MWEYSNEAVNLIKRFKEKFPEVIDALEKNPDGKNYSLEEIMPTIDDRSGRLQELIEWLAEVRLQATVECRPQLGPGACTTVPLALNTPHSPQAPPTRLPLTPVGCVMLSEDSVHRIEAATRQLKPATDKPTTERDVAAEEVMLPLLHPLVNNAVRCRSRCAGLLDGDTRFSLKEKGRRKRRTPP